MKRREFLSYSLIVLLPLLISSCGIFRIDPLHFLIRSPYIDSPEKEKEILSRAKLTHTADGKIQVLHVSGSSYEMGYQHGVLLRKEVRSNLGFLYEQAVKKFREPELLAEIYERMRPYIPQDYIDEMQGLAHGSRLPLHVIHAIHILPELGEWGGKKKIKKVIGEMMSGVLATSCSNLAIDKSATADRNFYAVRILDWGMHRISKLHKYPLITVAKPNQGVAYANIGWVGFLGAVSGINAEGITLGEMGYGDTPDETLFGKPMPFMLRDVLRNAHNLSDVRKIISESLPTCSFVFLMTDGKTKESELYLRDPSRFIVFHAGDDIKDKKDHLPPIADTLYGGHYNEKMTALLQSYHGKLSPEILMNEIIPKIAMPSNFQNVIYDPKNLKFWVSNAKSKKEWAASEPYTFFDFAEALK